VHAEDSVEMMLTASSTNLSPKSQRLILQLPTVTPRRLGCDCLSNSCRPVVLNPSSEGRIRLPGTLCVALSSLSIKRLIFCVTDFVLL